MDVMAEEARIPVWKKTQEAEQKAPIEKLKTQIKVREL